MKVQTLTAKGQKEMDEWIVSKPPIIRDMFRNFPADRLYRLKTTDHRCTILGYSEDGTMTVNITGEYNYVVFDRNVFGIKPENLKECDLPDPDEKLGTEIKDRKNVDQYLETMKSIVMANRN